MHQRGGTDGGKIDRPHRGLAGRLPVSPRRQEDSLVFIPVLLRHPAAGALRPPPPPPPLFRHPTIIVATTTSRYPSRSQLRFSARVPLGVLLGDNQVWGTYSLVLRDPSDSRPPCTRVRARGTAVAKRALSSCSNTSCPVYGHVFPGWSDQPGIYPSSRA